MGFWECCHAEALLYGGATTPSQLSTDETRSSIRASRRSTDELRFHNLIYCTSYGTGMLVHSLRLQRTLLEQAQINRF